MTQTKATADSILKEGYMATRSFKKRPRNFPGRSLRGGGGEAGGIDKGPGPLTSSPSSISIGGFTSSNKPQQQNTQNAGPNVTVNKAKGKREVLQRRKDRAKEVRASGAEIGADHAAALAKTRNQLIVSGKRDKNLANKGETALQGEARQKAKAMIAESDGAGGPGQSISMSDFKKRREPMTLGKDHGPVADGHVKHEPGRKGELKAAKQDVRQAKRALRKVNPNQMGFSPNSVNYPEHKIGIKDPAQQAAIAEAKQNYAQAKKKVLGLRGGVKRRMRNRATFAG